MSDTPAAEVPPAREFRIRPEGKREQGLKVGDSIVFKLDDSGIKIGTPTDDAKDWLVEVTGETEFKLTALKPGSHKVAGLPVLRPDGSVLRKTEVVELMIQSAINEKGSEAVEAVPLRPPVGLGLPRVCSLAVATAPVFRSIG